MVTSLTNDTIDVTDASVAAPGIEAANRDGPLTFALTRDVVVKSLPQSTTAESVHALRTHLVARHLNEGRRGLAICETEQSGGTFLAANLAISLAETGVRTLLIDTRLREPELANYIQPSHAVAGLADALERPDLPLGSIVQTVLPNLSLIYAGNVRENALDLISGPRVAGILDLCLREFDLTIATTSPANRYADGRRVASVLHYAIVTARKNRTFTADISTLLNELAGDNVEVIGTVFNDF